MVCRGDQLLKDFHARNWQGSETKGKHAGTRSEDKWWMSEKSRYQWRVPVPRLLEHRKWWHERHKRGSPWKSESGTRSNHKPPANTRTFCRTLRTVTQKGIGAFRFSAALIEWSQSELEGLQKIWVQAWKKDKAVAWVNCKLFIHLPNWRGWPWEPPVVRSAHASLAAACWPMHAGWRCCGNLSCGCDVTTCVI